MPERLPIFCSRCRELATLEISARDGDVSRSATACGKHRTAVRRWVSRAGSPTVNPISQPSYGQLALFAVTEVER